MDNTYDVEPEPVESGPVQALAVRDPAQAVERAPHDPQTRAPVTAAQAKIEAVANLTASAYARASELKLTPEEISALQAEFADDAFKPGAAGKESLIYIEHAFLRDRLNKVIGLGQWALIPRSRWAEDYSFLNKYKETVQASRVYVEAMLMVRGCFVSEAVGEMEYYKNNAGQNYGDAVEGAKTAALRRCCKEFGIGLQAWKKDWCAGWWARKNSGKSKPTPMARPAPARPAAPTEAPSPSAPAASPLPTPAHRARLVDLLNTPEGLPVALEYFQKVNAILPNEGLEDIPLEFIPATKDEMDGLVRAIGAFAGGDEARLPYPKHAPLPPGKPAPVKPAAGNVNRSVEVPRDKSTFDGDKDDPNSPDAVWRSFPMPWGKQSGTLLADLEKKYLYGLWANYEVETEYNGKPKRPETIAKDEEFRRMLDMAGEHYEFTKD